MESQESIGTAVQGNTLVKHAIRFGAIIGGVSVVLTLLLYAIDYSLLADWKIGLFFLALFIGLVIYGGINYRNQIGGFISYGKAFQHGYIALIAGGIIGTIFSLLLYTVIDPDLPQKLSDAAIEQSEAMMRGFGMPEDQLETQLDKMREEMPARFSPVGILKQFGWGLLINAIIVAITSIFVKRKEPEIM